jgi:hypothetical protein
MQGAYSVVWVFVLHQASCLIVAVCTALLVAGGGGWIPDTATTTLWGPCCGVLAEGGVGVWGGPTPHPKMLGCASSTSVGS